MKRYAGKKTVRVRTNKGCLLVRTENCYSPISKMETELLFKTISPLAGRSCAFRLKLDTLKVALFSIKLRLILSLHPLALPAPDPVLEYSVYNELEAVATHSALSSE